MHARTYSPAFGRFLQPDPAGAEANLYGYGQNSPVTISGPSGQCLVPVVGWIVCGEIAVAGVTFVVGATAWTARNIADYVSHHPININIGLTRQDPTQRRWAPPLQNPQVRDRYYLEGPSELGWITKPGPPSKRPRRNPCNELLRKIGVSHEGSASDVRGRRACRDGGRGRDLLHR